MIWSYWVFTASLFGALGVGFGAFGSHALKARLTPEALAIFEIGTRYHFYHVFALLAVGLIATRVESGWLHAAGIFFTLGILLFSGSLYGYALTELRPLAYITPIGGVCFIVGWLLLAMAMIKSW